MSVPEPQGAGRLFALPDPIPGGTTEALLEDFGPSTTLRGALSEMAAIQHLLEMGYKVAVPVVDDDGVDFVVNYHHTAQVKSSRRQQSTSWMFNYSTGATYRADGSRLYRRRPTHAAFFICHAVPIDAWWVIPRERLAEAGFSLESGQGFTLSSDPQIRSKYSRLAAECRDAWELLE